MEQFGRFVKSSEDSIKGVVDRAHIHCEKCQGCKHTSHFYLLSFIVCARELSCSPEVTCLLKSMTGFLYSHSFTLPFSLQK